MSSPHISVFTPTHNVQHLEEAYDSIVRQPFKDWEWVVIPNGPAIGNIPDRITRDKRVSITPVSPAKGDSGGVGFYKNFACGRALGDIFMELDHDDMLVPGIMQDVVRCVDAGAGFVFSDDAVISTSENGGCAAASYDANYGWETYDFSLYGKRLLATRNFDITARSLCEVYFAPDHVRCWTREVYHKAGGYDKQLTVGDDHRLVCRTYVSGAKFMHTGTVGYLYRRHKQNTVANNYDNIYRVQHDTKQQYMHKLIDRWTKNHGHTFVNLDAEPLGVCPAIAADTSTAGCVRVYSELLSSLNLQQLTALYAEIYRVLVPGGWLCFRAPSTEGIAAFAPHHLTHFNQLSPRYLSQQAYAEKIGWTKDRWRFQEVLTRTAAMSTQTSKELYVYSDLCALKGQRQPGCVFI